ncbi:MAG: methyltransferase [Halieaceae bacterium]|jgi:predicted methyltransferase|nr:methyltransferase [Halieaceae bacterium]
MVTKRHWILLLGLLAAGWLQAADNTANEAALRQAIEARPAQERARDGARHPAETLAFFRVAPGMTVAEALPGSGWYTNILANYLGPKGTLYGINYADRMWSLFPSATDEWIAKRKAATGTFSSMVKGFTDNGIRTASFTFSTVPGDVAGTVDRVLMIRALHNLTRFEEQAGTRSQALAAVRNLLKDDGLVGVVQHRAPATQSGADGSRGYLVEAEVIAMFEDAGFELVASSDINANPLDKPGPQDKVWRLPPSLGTSAEDPELRASMQAIGESDRMTLLFRKAP